MKYIVKNRQCCLSPLQSYLLETSNSFTFENVCILCLENPKNCMHANIDCRPGGERPKGCNFLSKIYTRSVESIHATIVFHSLLSHC